MEKQSWETVMGSGLEAIGLGFHKLDTDPTQ